MPPAAKAVPGSVGYAQLRRGLTNLVGGVGAWGAGNQID